MLFCFLEFGGQVGQPLNEANSNIILVRSSGEQG